MSWLLTRGRLPFLCALLALTVFLALHAARIRVERNNESLNTREPAQLAVYERFKARFGSDEDLLLAVAHPNLVSNQGLELLDSLTTRIAHLDGVRRVFSLSNAKQVVAGEGGAELTPLVEPPLTDPALPGRVQEALARSPELTGLFVSSDRHTAGLLIEIEDRNGDLDFRGRLIDQLRAIMAEPQAPGVSLHLTGIAVQKNDVSAYIERDQQRLIPLAVGVLALVLASFFRSAPLVLLPLAVTGVTTVWTLGAYGLAGFQLNAITGLLAPVLMVLSLPVSVHLIQGWLDAEAGQQDRVGRILGAQRRLLFPCFFCSLTTALGFASLATSNMPAVVQFGVFAALGVALAFCIGMTLVPVGLSFLAPPDSAPRSRQHRLILRLLAASDRAATEHPGRVLAIFCLLTAACLAGLPYMRNNTDLVRFLKSSAPLHRDTLFIDRHLTGSNALDFVVARSDGSPLTAVEDLQRMEAFERAALAREPVTGVTSILAVLRQLQRAETGGEQLVLPASQRAASYAFDLLEAAPDPDLIRKLIAPDFSSARFNVRIRALGTAAAAELAEAILADARRSFGDGYQVAVTGAFHHVAQDSNRLVAAQVRSFGLAVALVVTAIGALFRSLRLTFIALVPNLMPIAWTGGLMGALGIDLSIGTAMIASAVIGIIVDDTIHYMTQYRRVHRGDPAQAIRRATRSIGPALMINNLVLAFGFWIGCFGSFKPTIYFSLLSGITILSALLCDLLVTPACLNLFDRRQPAPSAS
jgi:predicted RND superfamily exporter protein